MLPADSARPQKPVDPARLAAFNFGIQSVWGAILAVSLQARTIALAPGDPVAAYGGLAASGAATAVVVQLLAGALSDRRQAGLGDRRPFYVAGLAVASAGLAAFYLASQWWLFAGAFMLLQAGMNVAQGPYQAAIPDEVARDRRGRASAWMAGFQQAGNAAGLLIAGFVHDLRVVATALSAALALSCAVTLGALRRRSFISPIPPFGALLGDARLLALLASRGAINVGFFTLLGFLLFFVRDALGVRPQDVVELHTALLFLTFTVSAIAGAALAAAPADRGDKRLVVTVACAVFAAALGLLAAAQGLPAAYAAAAVAGVAWGGFAAADWALASSLLPSGAMATAMAVWNLATAVPQIVAPLATAPLVVRLNALSPGLGPRAAILLAIGEIAVGAALIWRLPRA